MKPALPYFKKIKTDSRNNSPRGLKSPRYGTSEFFASLETQIKRVDPEFFFIWGEDSPLSQALNCVKQAIDSFLNKSQSTARSSSKDLSVRYQEEKSHLLFSKEKEELKKRAEDYSAKEEKLAKDKEKLRKMKKTLFELEDELKTVKEELNKEFLQLNQSKNKFRCEKEAFEKEKVKLADEKERILEAKLEIDRKELELRAGFEGLDKDLEGLAQDRAKFERDLWILDQEKEKNNEKLASLSKTREHVMLQYKHLEQERADLIKQKIDLSRLAKKEDSESEIRVLDKSDIEQVLQTVQNDLLKAEKELVQKSQKLDEREAKIKEQEKTLKLKLADLKNIKETLAKSSQNLNELISITFPKVQSDSKYTKQLLNQLSDTQKQLSLQMDSGYAEQVVLEGLKGLEKSLKIEELEKTLKEKIENFVKKEKKTEEKMNEVLLREKNVEIAEEKVNGEWEKLRLDHERRLKEIEAAKREMGVLQEKLDRHLEMIEKKERMMFEAISQVKETKY